MSFVGQADNLRGISHLPCWDWTFGIFHKTKEPNFGLIPDQTELQFELLQTETYIFLVFCTVRRLTLQSSARTQRRSSNSKPEPQNAVWSWILPPILDPFTFCLFPSNYFSPFLLI